MKILNNDRKNIIWNFFGAGTNAFVSLILAIVVTRINKIDMGGIFIYSFAIASLLYVVAIYAGRTFQVTETDAKISETDFIYNRILSVVIMLICAIAFVLFKQYDFTKAIIFLLLCLYKAIEAFSETLYAIIQKRERLYKVGISMTLKAVIASVVFIVIEILTQNLILATCSLVIVNILIIILYDLINVKECNINKKKFSNKNNLWILKTGFFTFALTFLSMYLINIPRNTIDDIKTEDIQAIFGIIIMPATFMALIGQFILQPTLTKIARALEIRDLTKLKNIVWKLINITLVIGGIVLVVSSILGIPVLQILYNVNLSNNYGELLVIMFGAIWYCIANMISTVLIAMRKTMSQTIAMTILAILMTGLSYYLVKVDGISGASTTYSITMILEVLVLGGILIYNYRKIKLNNR